MTILRRGFFPFVILTIVLATPPTGAQAQAVDCERLRAGIDAMGSATDDGHLDMALRRQRDEIARTRAYADDSGCGGDGVFDDSESAQCRGLARRVEQLQIGLQRLQEQASRGDPVADERRRAMAATYGAECSTDAAEERQPGPGGGTMPVDPDAPPVENTPAPQTKIAQVLCVRHCDGAYYPLAVDVAADRMDDMDRICQAQCPAAESSAYASRAGDDVANALASDGTAYSTLATAFKFRDSPQATCACRAPNQSWADALAGAEALLEPHKGDVTVTPALAASMARPAPPPQAGAPKAAAAKPPPAAKKTARKPDASSPLPAPPPPPQAADQGRDLTREFRRSDPTL